MTPRFRAFHPAVGDWVCVFVDYRAERDAVEPWFVQSVIGWCEVEHDGMNVTIEPLAAGQSLDYDANEWIGCYRRDDLAMPHVKQSLRETCELAFMHRERERAAMGCGTP